MATAVTSDLEPLPLNRFNRYLVRSGDVAKHHSRSMFPDLRGFSFLDREKEFLQSNAVHLGGWHFGTVASAGHRIDLNDESRFAMLLPFRGNIAVQRGRTEMVAGPGQLLSVRPGTRRTTVGPDYKGAVILIPRTALTERAALLEPAMPLMLLDDKDGVDPCGQLGQTLNRQILFTIEELDRSDLYLRSDRLARSILSLLSDLIVQRWLTTHAQARDKEPYRLVSPGQVERAEDFMRAMLSEPISIGDVAAHLGVSARALQLAFKKVRGTTPHGFLTSRRLELVHGRLSQANQGDTVTAIMHDCAIANPGRFAALYRQTYGEAPSTTLRRSCVA